MLGRDALPPHYRSRIFTAVLAVAMMLVGAASAQAVRYTVEIRDVDNRNVPIEAFRGGDIVHVRVGVHNASDRTLEQGGLWVALPPIEGVRTTLVAMGREYTNPERYLDADGRESAGFEPDVTALYPLPNRLPPGGNQRILIRLNVVSSNNGLANLPEDLRILNSFDRSIGTRVDELPAEAIRPDPPSTPPASSDRGAAGAGGDGLRNPLAGRPRDPVEQHIAAMFGHLGAVRYACPEFEDAGTQVVCGEVASSFRRVQQEWDLYFDWEGETPITAAAVDSWTRNEDGVYSRLFEIRDEVFAVAYVATGDNAGIVAVFIER